MPLQLPLLSSYQLSAPRFGEADGILMPLERLGEEEGEEGFVWL